MPKRRRRALKPLGLATNSGKFNLKRRIPSHPKTNEPQTPGKSLQPTPDGAGMSAFAGYLTGPAWLSVVRHHRDLCEHYTSSSEQHSWLHLSPVAQQVPRRRPPFDLDVTLTLLVTASAANPTKRHLS